MANKPDNKKRFPTFSKQEMAASSHSPTVKPDIEGYKIDDQLGEGGMGTVWRAVQVSTNREVALKVTNAQVFGSKRALVRFEREVELAARLEHPNIARVYDSGIHQKAYYYAMELVKGLALDDYVKEKQLEQRQIIQLMRTVISAIHYAHQRGIIHRDLKPSNILVTNDGQPHILDFGLAKDLLKGQTEHTVSMDGDILGTPAYMSPEQAEGQIDQVDVRSDVYSLGVILFQLLTGDYPYNVTGSLSIVLDTIRKTEPIRPKKIVAKFDSDLEAIILKTLAKDPDERYQSTGELKHDIECWLEDLPIVIKSVSSLYLLRKIITHHRYTSTVVALLLMIVLGFSGIYYYLYTQLRQTHIQLQATDQSLDTQTEQYVALGQHILLISHFLPAWHNGNLAKAKLVGQYFGQGNREAIAANFLLGEKAFEEKINQLRQQLENKEPGFTAFIEGEHHLRDGNISQAILSYERSLSRISNIEKDRWIVDKTRSRLYELGRKQ